VVVRVPGFGPDTAAEVRKQFDAARTQGAEHVLIDLRAAAEGDLDHGIATARLFVSKGALVTRETRTGKTPIEAAPSDGTVAPPVALLVDSGTSGAAELFAAALVANGRTTLIGEQTLGRTATQELVKLPDGSALWLSTTRYLTARDAVIHEKGLKPDVPVEGPEVEFGGAPPASDPILDKALEAIGSAKAAA
jgi:carboxyl-terminal processing protease